MAQLAGRAVSWAPGVQLGGCSRGTAVVANQDLPQQSADIARLENVGVVPPPIRNNCGWDRFVEYQGKARADQAGLGPAGSGTFRQHLSKHPPLPVQLGVRHLHDSGSCKRTQPAHPCGSREGCVRFNPVPIARALSLRLFPHALSLTLPPLPTRCPSDFIIVGRSCTPLPQNGVHFIPFTMIARMVGQVSAGGSRSS